MLIRKKCQLYSKLQKQIRRFNTYTTLIQESLERCILTYLLQQFHPKHNEHTCGFYFTLTVNQ